MYIWARAVILYTFVFSTDNLFTFTLKYFIFNSQNACFHVITFVFIFLGLTIRLTSPKTHPFADFTVYVDDILINTPPGQWICVKNEYLGPDKTEDFPCLEPIVGRYVTISLTTNWFAVCEIDVLAERDPYPGNNCNL